MSFFKQIPSSIQKNQKWILSFFFLFFLLLSIPFNPSFYQDLFATGGSEKGLYALFKLATYQPSYFGWTLYQSWILAVLVAVVGAFIGNQFCRETDFGREKMLYWLRVMLRYRLALAAFAYGLIKIFPLQMPYPSLSNLHTNYGDFLPWKIYFHTTGIAPVFETFLGLVEFLAGLSLLCRKTATFGAGILAGFYANVFASNIAYDMGYAAYSLQLTIFALVIFSQDARRLYALFVQQQKAIANSFRPSFPGPVKKIRIVSRILAVVFVVALGYATYENYTTAPFKYPKTPGIRNAAGYYNVSVFKLNDVVIPYSRTDTSRWQNVVFEKWATLSIKTAKPIIIDKDLGDRFTDNDYERNFESAGVGGRRYFAYSIDTVSRRLNLINKNKHHRAETFQLSYEMTNDSTIIVKGVNERNEVIYAELNRISKKYLLLEGRIKPIKL